MPLSFKPSELPNPVLLTAPENLEYMQRKEELAAAKEAKKAGRTSGKKRKAKDTDANGKEEPAPKKARSTKSVSKKDVSSSSSTSATADEIFAVYLDGEEDETVEMYDACDEIRKKIDIHLTMTGQTKAAFLRDIARAGWPHNPPKIQSKQLSDFQGKDGATSGSLSRVYYGAYCYFEKKRIAEGKEKSAHRLVMEDEWPNGMVREREQMYIIGAGMEVYTDEYGKPVVF